MNGCTCPTGGLGGRSRVYYRGKLRGFDEQPQNGGEHHTGAPQPGRVVSEFATRQSLEMNRNYYFRLSNTFSAMLAYLVNQGQAAIIMQGNVPPLLPPQ